MFYKTTKGTCPVEEFLDSLSAKPAKKVVWTLNLIEDLEIVPSLYLSKMRGTDDIWECRTKFGSNIYRIFAFFDRNKIILTRGIVKKTQKAPSEEIKRAESYKKDYFNRYRR
ncbi:MAG: type II toxin-antitoxin system RelE/ParE family toxin [Candidatus Omnitrophica bacterium]|nr:type II toxin-antitoxin system RelE/ParE family toxin [Candidatus Omnitrophota bacterium]